ncbi:TIGR04282 family arsenosugar biosynthesis glycosyltransferase [Thiogranum longum]|nr:TIGR04282 family arsenosugar biosynthesis glycosyltransferase [Thiogranum longum]
MARSPEYGQVKTRLAAGIGDDAALAVYRQLLEITLHTAADSRLAPVELHIDGDLTHPFVQALVITTGVNLVAQQGGDLGERMYLALRQVLDHHNSALIIGSDCPAMGTAYLENALQRLANGTEVVIGPSEDGGYVLIGGKRADERWFHAIDWGSDSVMQQTRTALQNAGMHYTELDMLWDVDYPEDYKRWQDVCQVTVNQP